MSCEPSYIYRPLFGASSNKAPSLLDCTAPAGDKHRSRLFAGGTYFRSINQGPNENNIELEVVLVVGSGTSGNFQLNIYLSGGVSPVETFGPFSQLPIYSGSPVGGCSPTAIAALRSAVGYDSTLGCSGSSTNNSSYIEMLPRGCDTGFDSGGADSGCLTAFSRTAMSGGSPIIPASYIPTTEYQDPIRSGPARTLFIVPREENYIGQMVPTTADRRLIQWDGSQWIYYGNNAQGSCPTDGPVVPFV